MTNELIKGVVDALRRTPPYRSLPVTNRPHDALWHAHNDALHMLRLPLHHQYLRKPRPKPAAFDAAIQAGLAILASFAWVIGTRQAIVRISDGQRQAISFQPRPFGTNWTAEHAISPVSLHSNVLDPLLAPSPPIEARAQPRLEVPTRDILHLAGKTALVLMNSTGGEHKTGHVTFVFDNSGPEPRARAVWRPLPANTPGRIVEVSW
jgi:hypothetical protein